MFTYLHADAYMEINGNKWTSEKQRAKFLRYKWMAHNYLGNFSHNRDSIQETIKKRKIVLL